MKTKLLLATCLISGFAHAADADFPNIKCALDWSKVDEKGITIESTRGDAKKIAEDKPLKLTEKDFVATAAIKQIAPAGWGAQPIKGVYELIIEVKNGDTTSLTINTFNLLKPDSVPFRSMLFHVVGKEKAFMYCDYIKK